MGHFTIQRKLLYIFSAVCFLLVVIVLILNTVKSLENYETLERNYIQSIAKTLKENLASSLLFSHRESADELLNSFKANQNIKLVALLDAQGETFARIDNQASLPKLSRAQLEGSQPLPAVNWLVHIEPISELNNIIGFIYIESSSITVDSIIYQDTIYNFIILAVVLVFIFFIANRFALSISSPVLQLSNFMNHLSVTKDYSLRIYTERQDEFRGLFDNVNGLLVQAERWTKQLTDNQAKLEQRVAGRTTELQLAKAELEIMVEKLTHASQQARDASEAKSIFIANMSHEIRTPMNGILGLTEILEETELDSRQLHLVNNINESGRLLMTIINDILDLSKIESGKFRLEPKWCNLRDIIEESTRYFSELCIKKGLRYAIDLPIYPCEHFKIDELRLNQVLYNLLSNAFKFTDKGFIKLSWRINNCQTGAEVSIWIQDSGIGIEQDKLSQIFHPFEQADSSTSRHFGGTGLGLSITQSIIDLMGGDIHAESKPGEGSIFKIALRLEQDPQQQRLYQKPDQFKGLNVALISSEDKNIHYVQKKLLHWGVLSSWYPKGKLALAYFTEQQQLNDKFQVFDLIWIDAQLEDMLSLSLASALKRCTDTPIVVESISSAGYSACVDRFEIKPVTTQHLYEILARIHLKQSIGQQQHTPPKLSGRYPKLTDVKVLLVEDNLTNQEFACSIFELVSCQYQVANNGLEALEFIEKDQFDVVIMDCQMPLMDGYEAAKAIRQMEQEHSKPRVPIVAVTAHAQVSERQKCLEANMDDYMSKPFKVNQLVKMLLKWTQKQQLEEVEQLFLAEQKKEKEAKAIPSLLDPEAIENLRKLEAEGIEGAVDRVLDKYLHEAPQILKRIVEFYQQGEVKLIAREAHSLKSMSATIGGNEVRSLCLLLEDCEAKSVADIAYFVEQLQFEFDRLTQAVNQLKTSA